MKHTPEDHGAAGDGGDLVDVERASNPLEARLVAGILRGAGIPAFVGGTMLADEFAMTQRLMNLQSVRVQVRRDQLAKAREVLAAARAAAAELSDEELERQALEAGTEEEGAGDAGDPPQ